MPVNSKYCTYDPVQKIWSGQKFTPIYNTEANLGYLILQKLIQSPQNVFQVSDDTGIELTNLEVYKRSIKFANFLTKSGLKQGDVLGLNASNSEHLAPIMFACFILGIAVNPLAVVMDVNDICYMWSKTKPKIIFCDGKIVEKVKISVDKMELDAKVYTVVEKVDEFLSADEVLQAENDNFEDFEFPDLPNISSTIALIACSSGTTNAPKGICKSHKQFICDVTLFSKPNLISQNVAFIGMSSYWVSFAQLLIYCAFFNGKYVIITNPITVDIWMDIVERHQVTIVIIVPVFGKFLLNSTKVRKLPSIRTVVVGGERFTENVLNGLTSIFPNGLIQCIFGCTEKIIVSQTGEDGLNGISSGYPTCNVKIKIVDESENALGPNEKGEIYFKSIVPFSGYFGDPEGSKLAFDSEGFVKSGDIGYIDDDGLLFVLYRVKHMMRVPAPGYGALIVAPIEIEDIINEIDGVMMSAVVGVFDMEIFLDIIYAFVIIDKSKVELTEEFVMNYVNARVIEAKRITGGVQFVDKFPMTPSGKIKYIKLNEIANEIHESKTKPSVDYSL